MALITPEEVGRQLGFSPTGDDRQNIETLIASCQADIEGIVGHCLDANTSRTEYYDGGGRYIYTDYRPITAVASLADDAQDGVRSIDSDNWISDSDDGGKNYRVGKVELWNDESRFGGGRLGVRIGYAAGYTTATLPADLKQAWIELVMFRYNAPDRIGVKQVSGGGQSVTYDPNSIPAPLMQVFRRRTMRVNY